MIELSALHMLIFAVAAMLVFRNRLSTYARSLGQFLVEFKNGMNELEGEFRSPIYSNSLRERQSDRQRIESGEPRLPPLYWPAIKFGVLIQAILGILASLVLDMGQVFGVFKIAFLCHWLGIFLLFARRPLSPTKVDIIFVRWGTLLLMIAVGLIAVIR